MVRTTGERISAIPEWIRAKVPSGEGCRRIRVLLDDTGLKSVCEEAACPNRGECWSSGHVTFILLGDICTRGCLFCNVKDGTPSCPDISEPDRIGRVSRELGLKYVVLTSVTRDDLPDGGASHFERTVKAVKAYSPSAVVEILIPDLGGREDLVRQVALSGADVIGHNIEMPGPLYPDIRPTSDYGTSMSVLRLLGRLKRSREGMFVKSGIMVGLGERTEDVYRTSEEVRSAGADIFYVGQYLQPTAGHWPVSKFYTPGEFRRMGSVIREQGFLSVRSGAMVRSSYKAGDSYEECLSRMSS